MTADSATVMLWRLDETAGLRIADAGSRGIEGRAGIETRPLLGRVSGARELTRSADSFIFSPYAYALESPEQITVEAWVRVDQFGSYEDTPIAMRWNPRSGDRSWLFSVAGRNSPPELSALPSPGDHVELMPVSAANRVQGKLVFAFQPADAGTPKAFWSNQAIELGRWTHAAATYDGRVVCLYLNGRLDAQYAARGRIRETQAGLLVGNAFDTRLLSTFGGDLRLSTEADHNPYYAFQGALDELRVSSVARTEFPYSY